MAYKSKLGFMVIISSWMLIAGLLLAEQHTSKKLLIIDAIEKVRTSGTPNDRSDAAYNLVILTKGVGRKDIDDKMINDMISLLDMPEGREWVAFSLGHLGSRAKKAVPKLYQYYAYSAHLN
jgi:hypothetical protein